MAFMKGDKVFIAYEGESQEVIKAMTEMYGPDWSDEQFEVSADQTGNIVETMWLRKAEPRLFTQYEIRAA